MDPNTKDIFGNTLLIIGAKINSFEIVDYLLDSKGITVNSKNNDGNSAFEVSLLFNYKVVIVLAKNPVLNKK